MAKHIASSEGNRGKQSGSGDTILIWFPIKQNRSKSDPFILGNIAADQSNTSIQTGRWDRQFRLTDWSDPFRWQSSTPPKLQPMHKFCSLDHFGAREHWI
jgi:hypothetical protein